MKILSEVKSKKSCLGHNVRNSAVVALFQNSVQEFYIIESSDLFSLDEVIESLKVVSGEFKISIVGSEKVVTSLTHAFSKKNPKTSKSKSIADGDWVLINTETGQLKIKKIIKSNSEKKVKVLVIEDSRTMRRVLRNIFERDDRIEIVGEAETAEEGLEMLEKLSPDVISLDINLPKMDGVEFLKNLGPNKMVPTVLITSLNLNDSDKVFNALAEGAVDYIQKPSMKDIDSHSQVVIDKVVMASKANLENKKMGPAEPALDAVFDLGHPTPIFIGSSTGGTNALENILGKFKGTYIPPIVIVQHIPAMFSKSFADRLNDLYAFKVVEASDGDQLKENTVYIAPGGFQMGLIQNADGAYCLEINDDEPVNGFKPSVDYLFKSVSENYKGKMTGVILTGMGKDGAQGLLGLKKMGAVTVAQDKESSVVFGMPRVAIELGGVDHVCHLEKIPTLLREVQSSLRLKKRTAA